MALKLMDEGAEQILATFFDNTPKESSFTVMLFTDPSSIFEAYTDLSFTPAAGGGYVDKTVTAANGLAGMLNGTAEMGWDDLVWTFTGPLTHGESIKGYVVIANTTMNVIFAELLMNGTTVTTFTPANNDDKLTIAMRFRLGNGTIL